VTIEFRELRTAAELAPMPRLEQRVWGGENELVAVNMLVATIHEGGLAIGAFDGDRLVGSVYGFATHDPTVLHSHYLAVDPDYRGLRLGVALKHHQREWCLANGRTAMRWTYDPLQVGNAHLNLRSLRAVGVAYHEDLYGLMGGINGGLPSDRVIVHWQLDQPPVEVGERQTIDVPAVSAADVAASSDVAMAARMGLREALMPLLNDDWLLVDVDRERRTYTVGRLAGR
jgi:predicted GNAT superfamily acetyltransferase